ncbi:MAG: hypothetical protein ACHRXM_15045 [Isosphaerales bacterium]
MVIRIDSGVARFGLPGVIVGVALAWVSGVRGPEASAQSGGGGAPSTHPGKARPSEGTRPSAARPSAGGDSNGTLALITSTAGPAQWLYLIDTKDRAFALYRIDPTNTKGVVKLEASRQYKWDLKLEHYNNQAPEPDAIKATVETLARSAQ